MIRNKYKKIDQGNFREKINEFPHGVLKGSIKELYHHNREIQD